MLFETHDKLIKDLKDLKSNYSLIGVKAEFEAEGSSVLDIARLKSISNKVETKLKVKIGGVEAVNDIYNCVSLEVDGLIAPMVETEFGLLKFIESVEKLDLKKIPELSINIETITGYKNIDKIIKRALGKISNITIGRSDFSKSYINNKIKQNSKEVTKAIINIANKLKKTNIKLTVGGGLDKQSIINFNKIKIWKYVNNLETRKIILPSKNMLKKKAVEKCLDFEKHYIINKKEIFDLKIKSEIDRLSNLKVRK
tara:strand:+ start:293 stop:1057 length:765 start_codon:yes stop_codon:yes gene_type:complete